VPRSTDGKFGITLQAGADSIQHDLDYPALCLDAHRNTARLRAAHYAGLASLFTSVGAGPRAMRKSWGRPPV